MIGVPVAYHVKLADVGFVHLNKQGTATVVTIDQTCCSGLPQAAGAVMGHSRPGRAAGQAARRRQGPRIERRRLHDYPPDLRRGIATGLAIFETAVPSRTVLEAKWLRDHLSGH